MGMVTEPVVTVLPTEEPDTMPHRAEEITATLAGPPEVEPATELARSMKKLEIPGALQERAEDNEHYDVLGTHLDGGTMMPLVV